MPIDAQSTVLRRTLSVLALALLCATTASAQRPFADSARAAAAASVVTRFIAATWEKGVHSDNIIDYTTGRFSEKMKSLLGQKPFPQHVPYEITRVYSIRSTDSVATVVLTSLADTVPVFGPLAIEMTFFVSLDSSGWKIADMRRFRHIEAQSDRIRTVHESPEYPSSLKPRIIDEMSTVLMSNAQLRDHFARNRAAFADLASRFVGRDSLRILGRTDRSIIQINRVGIEWGEAAQEIPKEAVDEYLASLTTPTQRAEFNAQLRHAERLRSIGRDSVVKHARRYGLSMLHLDSTIDLMAKLRVAFVNAELPWAGAVQMTVGGVIDDAIGYLYSPGGRIPTVSNEEYYYLEPIADGWWIFRAG